MNMGQSGSEVLYSDGKRIAVIHVIMHEFQLSFSEKKKKRKSQKNMCGIVPLTNHTINENKQCVVSNSSP